MSDNNTPTTTEVIAPERRPIMAHTITTAGELVAAVNRYDPDAPIRFAIAPAYPNARHGRPMQASLGRVVCVPQDAEADGTEPTGPPVVWIAEGFQSGYLPALVADALGWGRVDPEDYG
ncbi:hypothetical protein SAMN05192558_104105 [Actinokineospora alba]|uniref:Uncharacterized protein n=1 Tax=Actinokineospora alba TaxID=504798 RepID=A0A1H0LDN3_9PSEU|nr:hypothetical protein [Actinokineospora alba]TDP67286.1 hypothetical protein C8E96_2824 [Actinokineospora alba]SDJ01658.1 hypothetical protein SAMN05421871_109192 [Actinokineospora alba]SDO66202.1 hypothetical protein SAMN05192558_104105 [Actinokineospora alba]